MTPGSIWWTPKKYVSDYIDDAAGLTERSEKIFLLFHLTEKHIGLLDFGVHEKLVLPGSS